jgi:hypothetical protein
MRVSPTYINPSRSLIEELWRHELALRSIHYNPQVLRDVIGHHYRDGLIRRQTGLSERRQTNGESVRI